MRIAYLINQYPKVSHSFIRREILALERHGVEVLRLALRGFDAEVVDPGDLSERERTRYVLSDGALPLLGAVVRMLLIHPGSFLTALCLSWRMSRRSERTLPVHIVYLAEACRIVPWLRAAGIAHLHAHFGTNSAEVAMLTHALGGPSWSFTVHGPEEFDKAISIGLAEKVRRAAFVVVVSSFGRSQLYRLVDPPIWPKIQVVHCGIDEAFLTPKLQPPAAAALSPRRFICVGRLCADKGQFLLVEVARRLAGAGAEFQIVLAGDGDHRAALEALVARYGLQSKIRITGWISGERVREELIASCALVLPTFAEGLPVVIMEAMALRRPVISTYVAGIPELVLPGDHGWLVPAGDPEALAAAMRACLETSVETLECMGQAAHRRILERHDVDKEAAKLLGLFEESIAGRL